MIEIHRQCPMCGKNHYMELTDEQATKLWEYERGGKLIQEVFPDMDRAEREFLKTGYCSKCQEVIFDNGSNNIKEKLWQTTRQ